MSDAKKFDGDKVRLDLLSPVAMEEIANVLTFGAKKYDAWNWSKGLKLMRLYGAVMRHLFAWVRGETLDPESGLPHLAHAGCGIMFMIHLSKNMPSMDDRPAEAMQVNKEIDIKDTEERRVGDTFKIKGFDTLVTCNAGCDCCFCKEYLAGKHEKVNA